MHENPIYTEVNDPRYPQIVGRIELAPYHGMLTPPLDEVMNTGGRGISFQKPPLDEIISNYNKAQKDEGRRKPVKMENLRGGKPGWEMAEGTNWWSIDEKDPYWQTKRGYEEAMNLYGTKPGWVKEPSLEYNPKTGEYDPIEKEEFVDLKLTKRISL